jgi:hypothetical protein
MPSRSFLTHLCWTSTSLAIRYTVVRSARSARSTFSFEAVSLLPAVATSVDSFHHSSRGSDGRSSAIKP